MIGCVNPAIDEAIKQLLFIYLPESTKISLFFNGILFTSGKSGVLEISFQEYFLRLFKPKS